MPETPIPSAAFSSSGNWTRDQLKLAFHYYCQTPFGKLHNRNPEIIELAHLIGRTPSALAMKLSNFASLDPSITDTGRSGLKGASNLDREIWNEFQSDWERLAVECASLRATLGGNLINQYTDIAIEDFSGETKEMLIQQRIKQSFFRRAVLSGYRGRCCMSGMEDARLLIASHIVPWNKNKTTRLNPANGLCLSAIHDKAFDRGLITLSNDLRVVLSGDIKRKKEDFIKSVFLPIENKQIEIPERFVPHIDFLTYHREQIFIGA